MTNEQLAFNRGRGIRGSIIEIHEKDFIDRVSFIYLNYCFNYFTRILFEL